ncbi:uncharacterized protein LOC114677074 isoform X2 [Macaca mulatta]
MKEAGRAPSCYCHLRTSGKSSVCQPGGGPHQSLSSIGSDPAGPQQRLVAAFRVDTCRHVFLSISLCCRRTGELYSTHNGLQIFWPLHSQLCPEPLRGRHPGSLSVFPRAFKTPRSPRALIPSLSEQLPVCAGAPCLRRREHSIRSEGIPCCPA